jgi:hypothetical protein
MTTTARVVPTALAASPNAPLPLEAAVPLLADQQGRLLVNVATSVFPPTPPAPVVSKSLSAYLGGQAPVLAASATLLRIVVNVYAGAGGGFLFLFNGPTPGFPTIAFPIIPLPATVPAYVDVSFDDVGGLSLPNGFALGVSQTAPLYTVDPSATGEIVVFYV